MRPSEHRRCERGPGNAITAITRARPAGTRSPRHRSASRQRTVDARRRSLQPRSRTRRSGAASHPASRPCTSAPPKASPAPRPHTTSTRRAATTVSAARGGDQHAVGAELDDGELDATGEQRVGGGLGRGHSHRDLALLAVADGDRHHVDRRADDGGRVGLVRPQRRPVVEVEHRVPAPGAVGQHGADRRSRRLLGERRSGDPQHGDLGHGGVVDVADARAACPAREAHGRTAAPDPPAGSSPRTPAACAAPDRGPTKRVSTPNDASLATT